MASTTGTSPGAAAPKRRTAPPSQPIYLNEGLSTKKTALIIVTVVGCIAILWPKVFYPMMFGGTSPKPNTMPDGRAGPGGCCEVVLDREHFLNATPSEIGPQLYRKQLNLFTGEISIRQERPAHLHPESIYQAMRERGRAIPATPTVPILERKGSPSNPPPRIVEGRPGPIPGMRPPMGAGALHQPQAKGTSMGFIMPLYTIGIIVFFGYTIMKLVFKKPIPNAPYGQPPADTNFRKEVFGQENGRHVEEFNGSKLGWREHQTRTNLQDHATATASATAAALSASASSSIGTRSPGSDLYNASLSAATVASNLSSSLKQHQLHHRHQCSPSSKQAGLLGDSELITAGRLAGYNKETEQLMEIEKLRKKLEDTEKAMAKLIAEMNSDQYDAKKSNENSTSINADISNGHTISDNEHKDKAAAKDEINKEIKDTHALRKRREGSSDRSVAVLGMEVTASCEGGQKWTGRPPTPVFLSHNEHSKDSDEMPEPQSIYLEGSLAHDSKILVADSEITTEKVYDAALNGSPEEPAVVLSSKMTLSLINLDTPENERSKCEIESPLADDIEIIGHDEK